MTAGSRPPAAGVSPATSPTFPAGACPASLLNEQGAEIAPCRMVDQREILGVLRGIHQQRRPVTVYFNRGDEFFQSRLLAINPQFEELVLDIGTDAAFNEHFAASKHIIFVTSDHEVRVQFAAQAVELVWMDDLPAFRVRVPDSLIRLQRRNFYRIVTPIANPLLIQIPDPTGLSGVSGRISAKVIDLSCGGTSILLPDSRLTPATGDWYDDCLLDLGAEGLVRAALEVCHVNEEHALGRVRGIRLRCRFRGLGESGEHAIQRYIRRLEVERRHRL